LHAHSLCTYLYLRTFSVHALQHTARFAFTFSFTSPFWVPLRLPPRAPLRGCHLVATFTGSFTFSSVHGWVHPHFALHGSRVTVHTGCFISLLVRVWLCVHCASHGYFARAHTTLVCTPLHVYTHSHSLHTPFSSLVHVYSRLHAHTVAGYAVTFLSTGSYVLLPVLRTRLRSHAGYTFPVAVACWLTVLTLRIYGSLLRCGSRAWSTFSRWLVAVRCVLHTLSRSFAHSFTPRLAFTRFTALVAPRGCCGTFRCISDTYFLSFRWFVHWFTHKHQTTLWLRAHVDDSRTSLRTVFVPHMNAGFHHVLSTLVYTRFLTGCGLRFTTS